MQVFRNSKKERSQVSSQPGLERCDLIWKKRRDNNESRNSSSIYATQFKIRIALWKPKRSAPCCLPSLHTLTNRSSKNWTNNGKKAPTSMICLHVISYQIFDDNLGLILSPLSWGSSGHKPTKKAFNLAFPLMPHPSIRGRMGCNQGSS